MQAHAKAPPPFLLYSRGEHCSPALAEPTTPQYTPPHCWRACHAGPYKQKARLTQKHPRPGVPNAGSCVSPRSPHRTPPPSPQQQPRKYTPAPLAGLQCRPLQAKGKPHAKTPQPFLLYSRGEHCSPAKALCCRKAPRVEQSPTPTINRKRVLINFSAIS